MKFSIVAGLSLAALALSADLAHAQRLRGAIRRGAGIAQVIGGVRGRIAERVERVQGPTEADRQRELQSYQEGYQTALQQREAEQRLAARAALGSEFAAEVQAAGWEREAYTLIVPGESAEIAEYRRPAYDPAPYLGPVPTDPFDDAPDVAEDTVARYPYRAAPSASQQSEEYVEPLYAPLRRPSGANALENEIYETPDPGSEGVADYRSRYFDPSAPPERYELPYDSPAPQTQSYRERQPSESPLVPRGGSDLREGSDTVGSIEIPADGGRPTSMSF